MADPAELCQSCGREDEALVSVHRIYVILAADGQPEHHQRVDEPERWCFPCRTHYPHEVADEHSL